LLALLVVAFGLAALPRHLTSRVAVNPDFAHFESSHVHPVALTPDGDRLLVVNTPDNRLSVFDLTGPAPIRVAEIPVGLEPVSVVARSDGEAWVVNTLSDDVSIVDLGTLHTRATLRVGDEPSDVVFAGSPARAFVSVSAEDAIKVYDPANLASPPTVIPIPGRMPRALAPSADGSEVLVDVFNANGGTTVLSALEVGDSMPPPNPPMNPALPPPPPVALIVKQNAVGNWVDEAGHLWNSKIPYAEPPVDLVYLDVATRTVSHTRTGIATVNLGLAVSPITGAAAVTGTEALNHVRFVENVRGHMVESRLALVPAAGGAHTEVGLDPHIDYATTPGPPADGDSAIGLPTGVAWSPDGQRVYVSSLSTDRLGVLGANGALLARIPTVAGPTGVIADPERARLYVVGRFRNQLQTLSTADFSSVAVAPIGFDPTPDVIVNGRKFFYGGFTSGHGDQSCASCHLFGNTDLLAWDLGDPQGEFVPPSDPQLSGYHPMKGPMVTQSLRGLPNTGVLHWRGDRADLNAFNPAFVALMGRTPQLPDSEMSALEDFLLPLAYPPNPNQNLDRTFPDAPPGQPSAQRGRTVFTTQDVIASFKCQDCHRLPLGTSGQVMPGISVHETQDVKVPQLRNLYFKVGYVDTAGAVSKRGFGYVHDGRRDRIQTVLRTSGFFLGSPPSVADQNRMDLEAFLLAFDTGMPPAVGRQITFDGTSGDVAAGARLDTLESQAVVGNCDLIAKGRVGGTPRGWLYQGGLWQPDLGNEPPITRAQMLATACAGHEITVTGVPTGSGLRMGLDRDRDTFWDGDELYWGSDPGDPGSIPHSNHVAGAPGIDGLSAARPNPFHGGTELALSLARPGRISLVIHDVMGREVRTLARDQLVPAGPRTLRWDGRRSSGEPAAAGVYFARLTTPSGRWGGPLVMIR
jgi:YVTN family beta-propeller protein